MKMIKKRNIAVCIILSIVTCGIYGIYWLVVLNDDTNRAANDPNGTSGGMVILFTILTCGIYGYYWAYKMGEKIDYANQARNIPSSNSGILYLILSIFGLAIVAYALIQDNLNKIADADGYIQ